VKTFVADYIREISEADSCRDVLINRYLIPAGVSGDENLYCTATLPVDRAEDGRVNHAVIICPPFLEERVLSQRLLVRFQKYLAARGHVGVRFDYRGTGDSSGDISQVRLESMKCDLRSVIEFTRDKFSPGRISLLGVRLGGSVVVALEDPPERPQTVVLWSPIVSLSDYIQELYKLQIVSDGKFGLTPHDSEYYASLAREGKPVQILGYLLNPGLIGECESVSQLVPRFDSDRTEVFRLGSRQHQRYTDQLDKFVLDCRVRSGVVSDRRLKCPSFWSDGLSYWEELPQLFEETLTCLERK
jgi:pimeloyl-ACP methyl ester carboxylesterase